MPFIPFSFHLISFSYLSALAWTLSKTLNRSVKGGHCCLILDLMGSVQYFTIKYDVTCGIFLDALYHFIMKWCWVLLNAFSAERIIWYISCILLIWYITLTVFDGMLNHCCISGINRTRGVKFFIYVACFDFVEDFDVHIHKGYWSIVFLCFFSLVITLVSIREVLASEWVGKSSFFYFFEALLKDWY